MGGVAVERAGVHDAWAVAGAVDVQPSSFSDRRVVGHLGATHPLDQAFSGTGPAAYLCGVPGDVWVVHAQIAAFTCNPAAEEERVGVGDL